MSLITLNRDIEQHYLQYEGDSKPKLIEEPKGWKSADKQITRSKDDNEFISKNAKDVRFFGVGREYILQTIKLYGEKAKIRYTIVKENPTNSFDFYQDVYFLDLIKFKDKKGILSVKIEEGGIAKVVKSKGGQNLEYNRVTDLYGNNINPVLKQTIALEGRKIFLKSTIKAGSSVTKTRIKTRGNTRMAIAHFPLKIESNSDKEHIVTPSISEFDKSTNKPDSSQVFYLNSDRKKKLKVIIDMSCWINPVLIDDPKGAEYLKIIFRIYKGGLEFNTKRDIELYVDPAPLNHNKRKVAFSLNESLLLEKGDSMALICVTGGVFGGGGLFGDDPGFFQHDFYNADGSVVISEDSEVETTKAPCIYIHDVLEKQIEIITGKPKIFYSELFGRKEYGYKKDGIFGGMAVTNGLAIRGFNSAKDDKRASLSFKDLKTSLNATCGIGTMIEKIGFKERVRIEGLDFFYMPNVTVELPNIVEDLEISPAIDFVYSGYTFGYEKGGDGYEEATGIGEYNGKVSYTNELDNIEKDYTLLSKVRADSSAIEFARRKHKKTHPQADTQYDLDSIFLDTKKGSDYILLERKWQDDFELEPEGIYDPNTATNLRFTPGRMRDRRSLFLASSLFSYPESYIRYTSANCNVNLKSQEKGSSLLHEGGAKQVKSYGRAKFQPYWAKFTHKVDFSLSKKLRSKVVIDGEERYVFYGIVKFKVAEDIYRYGYMFEVKESGKGTWKVLLANK